MHVQGVKGLTQDGIGYLYRRPAQCMCFHDSPNIDHENIAMKKPSELNTFTPLMTKNSMLIMMITFSQNHIFRKYLLRMFSIKIYISSSNNFKDHALSVILKSCTDPEETFRMTGSMKGLK